ncbi:30S ribosomal protein S20 [Longimonas halophila]|uniref:Small ribosomal subunit protein bS20 n=1 Tax=Longimonas halophila TaxID=1469170 RepID=A0A2H3NY22_9BACT|nr:30S ribosomal protein S20 [Longimonas halophila]PEN05432.1 30S ribosomal protein S20 [Longimonas halophila]
MPQNKSAKKRLRQDKKKRTRNRAQKRKVRTLVQQLKNTEDPEVAAELLPDVKRGLDRLASKNLIHKNKAANKKSKLEKYVNSL